MNILKKSIIYSLILVVMSSFSQCDGKELQAKSPVELGDVYCQNWVAGVEGGGGGLNIYIPTDDTSVTFEQVYFRGKIADLESKSGIYIGRFDTGINQPKDIQLDGTSKAKETKEKEVKIPFNLEEDQCVVAYKDGKKTKYFMIDGITEKPSLALPSAPKGGGDIQIKNL